MGKMRQNNNPAKQLVTKREHIYFALALLSNALGFIYILVGEKWYWGIFLAVGLALPSLFMHGLFIASIRVNGIKLSERQFPDTYARIQDIAHRIGIKKVPNVYVLQSNGVLNAFATRFYRKNYIVLLSSVFELAKENSTHLDFIVAHELAHIKRGHVNKHMWLGFANLIPFLTRAYSRACEFTCDRMAYAYTGSKVAATEGLLILGAGERLYKDVDIEEFIQQSHAEKGFFVWLTKALSTHPTLADRIEAIEQFSGVSSDMDDEVVRLKQSSLHEGISV